MPQFLVSSVILQMPLIIAFDAIYGSRSPSDSLLQIGAVVLESKSREVVSRFSEFTSNISVKFEKKYIDEVWQGNLKAYHFIIGRCQKSGLSQLHVRELFLVWLQSKLNSSSEISAIVYQGPNKLSALLSLDLRSRLDGTVPLIDVQSYYTGLYSATFRVPVSRVLLACDPRRLALAALQTRLMMPPSFGYTLPLEPSETDGALESAIFIGDFYCFVENCLRASVA